MEPRYIVVIRATLTELMEGVEKVITEGWKVTGGVSCDKDGNFMQALVNYYL